MGEQPVSLPGFRPLQTANREDAGHEMQLRAGAFSDEMQRRRSVRHFSPRSLPNGLLETCLRAALSAPSGANLQPWHYAVVTDPQVKRRIRQVAEEQERSFYSGRASDGWLEALTPLATGPEKPFLETAPCLIAIFVQRRRQLPSGQWIKCPYALESVGIATGMLIAALHHAGLACLTYTPSPMGFLNDILGRPKDERPFVLLVTGYPAEDAIVPDVPRRAFDDVVSYDLKGAI